MFRFAGSARWVPGSHDRARRSRRDRPGAEGHPGQRRYRSTSDKQKVFSDNFPLFVAALDAFETGRPNLHIGVVSTTVDIGVSGLSSNCPHPAASDDGLLQNTPRVASCSPPRDRYIEDVKLASGARQINYSGNSDGSSVMSGQRV